MGFVGALALELGLSFGLGGRETAGEVISEWYQTSKQAAPKIAKAADVAETEVRSEPSSKEEPRTMHRSSTRPRYERE